MLSRGFDRSGAEQAEALRLAQHRERLGAHLTPG
jgi:hypothetical protein